MHLIVYKSSFFMRLVVPTVFDFFVVHIFKLALETAKRSGRCRSVGSG